MQNSGGCNVLVKKRLPVHSACGSAGRARRSDSNITYTGNKFKIPELLLCFKQDCQGIVPLAQLRQPRFANILNPAADLREKNAKMTACDRLNNGQELTSSLAGHFSCFHGQQECVSQPFVILQSPSMPVPQAAATPASVIHSMGDL